MKCCDKSFGMVMQSVMFSGPSVQPQKERNVGGGYHGARRIAHVRRSQLVSLSGKRKSRLSGCTISISTSTSLSSPSMRCVSMRFSFLGRGIITG